MAAMAAKLPALLPASGPVPTCLNVSITISYHIISDDMVLIWVNGKGVSVTGFDDNFKITDTVVGCGISELSL
jgi:hypothetical protein